MDNVERFVLNHWRECREDDEVPSPYPPAWVDTRDIIERNTGIKKGKNYPQHNILFANPTPLFFDLSTVYKPAN
jgi:hypothetical protein